MRGFTKKATMTKVNLSAGVDRVISQKECEKILFLLREELNKSAEIAGWPWSLQVETCDGDEYVAGITHLAGPNWEF